ncbi:copper amine oxidase N-terminal domain-containing protein [Paenibacillus montanisoli]|uniref:Copper amine oxidase-like N-terminal domain-containing protein n=1 Tax=Paenibacillus montanisoli TaxID=2081970 RepID=A0A328TWE0_9BACL|nr:copper amine oxidase N-terminal domain-containing protein [Paenibacillus montanisoli]RAP74670.1 hypothetical protein DL346_21725 [Paenibacillus montanisoli]
MASVKRAIIAAAFAATLLTAGVSGGSAKMAAAAVSVTHNEFHTVNLHNKPRLEGGTVLLPLREMGDLLKARTTYFTEDKRIAIVYPSHRIEMKLGSATATMNGETYKLAAPPKNVNGTVFVPIRFVSEALGVDVNWMEKEKRVNLNFDDRYLTTVKGTLSTELTYWLDRNTGELFASNKGEAARLVAETKVELSGYGGLGIALTAGADVLTVTDYYGEPSLNTDIYKIVVTDGKLSLETKAHYWGTHPIRNIEQGSNGSMLFIDGTTLYEADDGGAIKAKHDLRALTGYEDEAFQVEWYDNDIMVVRPHETGWLTLIDRKTGQATRLIEKVATPEQVQTYLELAKYPTDATFQHWDGLKVTGREGNTLKLKHTSFQDGSSKTIDYSLE